MTRCAILTASLGLAMAIVGSYIPPPVRTARIEPIEPTQAAPPEAPPETLVAEHPPTPPVESEANIEAVPAEAESIDPPPVITEPQYADEPVMYEVQPTVVEVVEFVVPVIEHRAHPVHHWHIERRVIVNSRIADLRSRIYNLDGTLNQLRRQHHQKCQWCRGAGQKTCVNCSDKGTKLCKQCRATGVKVITDRFEKCKKCESKGNLTKRCKFCRGKGTT